MKEKKKKNQTTKTRLVKTVCASLKAAGRAGGEPAHVLAARVWGSRLVCTEAGLAACPGPGGMGDKAREASEGGWTPRRLGACQE